MGSTKFMEGKLEGRLVSGLLRLGIGVVRDARWIQ